MKLQTCLVATLGFAMAIRAADAPAPVVYMDAAKVAEALAKTGLITTNSEFMVAGAHREKPGQVEVHEKTTDILFVVDGEALYVTGGKMIDGKQTRPGKNGSAPVSKAALSTFFFISAKRAMSLLSPRTPRIGSRKSPCAIALWFPG